MHDCDDDFDEHAMHTAASRGDIDLLKQLFGLGFSIQTFDDQNMTPLHHAAMAGMLEAAVWLLKNGAKVNAFEHHRIGETALCLAVQSQRIETVELLLRRGADPDISGWMGYTARIRAHQTRNESGIAMALLIEKYCPVKQNPGVRHGADA